MTGIEIHPCADVGDGLFIDHGMGVVIGETAEIGENVTLYQGVTLGGTGFATGKRHPTVEDNVTIGSGAKLLGPIRIGHGAKIGANAVVVHDVPPNSTVVGNPGHPVRVEGRKPEGPDADWVHLPDPIADALKALSRRIAELEQELDEVARRAVGAARRRAAAAARARAEPRRWVAPARCAGSLLLIAVLALPRWRPPRGPGPARSTPPRRRQERSGLRPPRRVAEADRRAGRGAAAADHRQGRRADVRGVPARAARCGEGGGSVGGALPALQQKVGRPGTYVLVAGRTFRAGSTDLREGATAQAANAALKAHPGDIDAILLDFTDRMGDLRAGREPAGDSGGGVPRLRPARVPGPRHRRHRAARHHRAPASGGASEAAAVRGGPRQRPRRRVELGDEIRALDLDVQMPGMPEEAKTDYETALGAYERASAAVDRARARRRTSSRSARRSRRAATRWPPRGRGSRARSRPSAPRRASSTRATGRPRARSSGRRPTAQPREVPACEADAQRVERGEDPDPRQITLGGRQMPYWNAGPAYAPYMGGFFGGGLLPGLFIGSMLGGGCGRLRRQATPAPARARAWGTSEAAAGETSAAEGTSEAAEISAAGDF